MTPRTQINADSETNAKPDGYIAQAQAYRAAWREYRRQKREIVTEIGASTALLLIALFGVGGTALGTIAAWICLVASPSWVRIGVSSLTVAGFCACVRWTMASGRRVEQECEELTQLERTRRTLPIRPDELPQAYLVRESISPTLSSPATLLRSTSSYEAETSGEELLRAANG